MGSSSSSENKINPSKNNTHIIVIGVFVGIVGILAIAGVVLGATAEKQLYKETLVTNNNSVMTLKSGNRVLYTYSLDETPAARKDRYSGFFNVSIQAPDGVPNIDFFVKDDSGAIISDPSTIIRAPVTKVPFIGVRSSRFIYLHVDVKTGNQNLKNITVHIDK